MDFEVTDSAAQQRFRQQVRAWLEANVPPGGTRIATSPEDSLQRYRELRALGDKGWLYPRAPAHYGGGGLDVDHSIILEEEADRVGLALPPYYDSGGECRPRAPRRAGQPDRVRARGPHADVAHALLVSRRSALAQAPHGRRVELVTH
jgi:alkylation response protein AidB-like acyl-CoA dehydrogenase